MATSNEWQQIYHNNLTGPPHPTVLRWSSDVATEATTVTSTITTAGSFSNDHLSRVARPTNTRRRSRVSRRTPTTLLNTDTTNFRAMVQQFTGGNVGGGSAPRQPLTSYNTISSGYNNNYGTGLSSSNTTTAAAATMITGGYDVEFRQPQQHQYYYSAVADKGGATSGNHHLGFVQEGGTNISGDTIHGDKNTTFMF